MLLPLPLGEELAAFVCVGEKHSGDVYTSTDLALLEGLADRARGVLLHFDQAEVLRQERALMEKLRRYVPGAVAEYIGSDSLEAGEQEVTSCSSTFAATRATPRGAGPRRSSRSSTATRSSSRNG